MDRIDAMQAFVAVADLQGVAPAARKLGLSPSGVTRLIAALEQRLGARLLQRTTRSVTLTDIGARYLERARRILADVEEAEGSAQDERTRPNCGWRIVWSIWWRTVSISRSELATSPIPAWLRAMSARCGGSWSPRQVISSSAASRTRQGPSHRTKPFSSAP